MKKEKTGWNFGIGWLIIVFFIGIVLGWSLSPKQITDIKNIVETRYVPTDMKVITYSDLKWYVEPKIYCELNGEHLKNGTMFLYASNWDEIKRTEDSIIYGPKIIDVYSDVYPNQVVYFDKNLGREYIGNQVCRVNTPMLSFKKKVVYQGQIVLDEEKHCYFEGFYPNEERLNPQFVVKQIKKCLY